MWLSLFFIYFFSGHLCQIDCLVCPSSLLCSLFCLELKVWLSIRISRPHLSCHTWLPVSPSPFVLRPSPPLHIRGHCFFLFSVSSHLVTWAVVSCKKFTSSYRREMTDDSFFMWGIKNSKDPFPLLYSETEGKKTSLNNGWEKGLLRKESQCGAIELRGEGEWEGTWRQWRTGGHSGEKGDHEKKRSYWRMVFIDRERTRDCPSMWKEIWPAVVETFLFHM